MATIGLIETASMGYALYTDVQAILGIISSSNITAVLTEVDYRLVSDIERRINCINKPLQICLERGDPAIRTILKTAISLIKDVRDFLIGAKSSN